MANVWIQAARPKTLLVSISPVITAVAIVIGKGEQVPLLPAVICFLFAVLAQVISNWVNDYADFEKGADDNARLGPKRMLASGLITKEQMRRALILITSLTALLGLSLVYWGGWWLLAVGAFIFVGAYSYSAGPWPLAYHGLGDVAVILFYGVVPVAFTHYLLCSKFGPESWLSGLAMGLVACNLLIVNNYRDCLQDAVHGKKTTVVIFGKRIALALFLINPVTAFALGYSFVPDPLLWSILGALFLTYSTTLWIKLRKTEGALLNTLLGKASLLSTLFALMVLINCTI